MDGKAQEGKGSAAFARPASPGEGAHPSLTDLDQGGLKSHTDFRRVYATALKRWLGYDARAILGETFEPLDVI